MRAELPLWRLRCAVPPAPAAEVGNLAYMERLGLWGPGAAFPSFQAFLDSMKRRGITFLEVGPGPQACARRRAGGQHGKHGGREQA